MSRDCNYMVPPPKRKRSGDGPEPLPSGMSLVRTSDGVDTPVSPILLASHSHFFRAFFFGPLSKPANDIFQLSTVNSQTLRRCIDLLNKVDDLTPQSFSLTEAFEILEAATYLDLTRLEKVLTEIICNLVDPSNIVQVYMRAGQADLELAKHLWTLIVSDFQKLYENKSYLLLSEREMISLMEDEETDIRPGCEHLAVLEWIQVHSKEETEELRAFIDNLSPEGYKDGYPVYRRRYPRSILLSIGGWSSGGVTNAIEIYSMRDEKWTIARTDTNPMPVSYHGLIHRNDGLFLVGGFNGSAYFNSNYFFDFESKTWSARSPMSTRRSYVSTVGFGQNCDRFIAMGGFTGRERVNTVELYDIERNAWKPLPSMNLSRSDASAVFVDERVYICGGFDGHNIHSNIEVFDPQRMKWELISRKMRTKRTGVAALTLTPSVFGVFGGFNGDERLKTCEVYDTREGKWHALSDMRTTRSNFSLEMFESHIVVTGGFDGYHTTNAAESYDIRANRWTPIAPLVAPKSALKTIRVEDLDVIRTFTVPA